MSKPLDYARGYFIIFPPGYGGEKEASIFIEQDCPADIRDRLEHDWPIIKKKTEEQHKNGIYSSKDYF